MKFQCDKCESIFKKNIRLENHKNTMHNLKYCSPKKKIWEGQFGFAFDTRPGKEAEAEAVKLEWKEQTKDGNTLVEKENNNVSNKVEKGNHEKVNMMRKTKKAK